MVVDGVKSRNQPSRRNGPPSLKLCPVTAEPKGEDGRGTRIDKRLRMRERRDAGGGRRVADSKEVQAS